VVDVNEVTANGIGKKLGTISFQDSDKRLNHYPCFSRFTKWYSRFPHP
jgi:hypothetical protein